MNTRHCRILLVGVALGLAAAPRAEAQTVGAKLARGVAGITTGILELPGNIAKETHVHGAAGIPVGFGMGLGMVVVRELVGVYELLTFPFPLPANYAPILHPEYPWSYFAQTAETTPKPR